MEDLGVTVVLGTPSGDALNHGGKDHRLRIPRGAEALPGLGARVGPDGRNESHLAKPKGPMGTAVVFLWERPGVWHVSTLASLPPTGLFLAPMLLLSLSGESGRSSMPPRTLSVKGILVFAAQARVYCCPVLHSRVTEPP